MTIPRRTSTVRNRSSPHALLATGIFIVVFAILLYLLGASMVSHHFFSGGH
jgi:hypothetical protein